ncbi:hypothetical protein [Natronomonas sp. EA1]|uniref:hypothetical protein n=1 Tax=Natronomonas sp. EA1 TaxID=3421655 RepID=UPI003EBDA212
MREQRAVALALLLVVSLFATPVAASGATVTHACASHELVAAAENGTLPAEPGLYLVVCDATGAAVPYAPVVATTAGNYSAAARLFLTDETGVAVLPVATENVSLDLFAYTPTGAPASASDAVQLTTNGTAVVGLALGEATGSPALTDPLGAYVLPADAEPGELVSVRTVVLAPAAETRMAIADRYDGAEVDIGLHAVSVGGGNATVVLELDAADGVDVAIETVEGGAVITLLTNVTVPTDATVGTSVTVAGAVNTTDGDGSIPAESFPVVAPPAPPTPQAPAPTPEPTPSPAPAPSPAPTPSADQSTGSRGGSGGSASRAPPTPEPAPVVVEPAAVVTLADGAAVGNVSDLDGPLVVPVGYAVDGVGVESVTVASADPDFAFDLRFADRPDAGLAPLAVGDDAPIAYLVAGHSSTAFESATLTLTVDAALVADPDTVRFYRHDGEWTPLAATFVYESDGRYVYAVETIALGSFAVSAPSEQPYTLAGVAKPALDDADAHTLFLSVGYEGRAAGVLDLVVTVNGEPAATQQVELVPGETETVTFTVETVDSGVYDIAVNGRLVDSVVRASEAPDQPAVAPTPEPMDSGTPAEDVPAEGAPASGPVPTAAVLGGVLVALAAGALLVLRR